MGCFKLRLVYSLPIIVFILTLGFLLAEDSSQAAFLPNTVNELKPGTTLTFHAEFPLLENNRVPIPDNNYTRYLVFFQNGQPLENNLDIERSDQPFCRFYFAKRPEVMTPTRLRTDVTATITQIIDNRAGVEFRFALPRNRSDLDYSPNQLIPLLLQCSKKQPGIALPIETFRAILGMTENNIQPAL